MADQGLYPAPINPYFLLRRSSEDCYPVLPGPVLARVIDSVTAQQEVGIITAMGV